MGETNGEKLYNAFDSLIDEAESLKFFAVAEKLRRMRDRLPNKPTSLDEGIGLLYCHSRKHPTVWVEKIPLDELKQKKHDLQEAIRKAGKVGVSLIEWDELDTISNEIKRRKALLFLDKNKETQAELSRIFP